MPEQTKNLPDWEILLSVATHFQSIPPDAAPEEGTASARPDKPPFSHDEDLVLSDLKDRHNKAWTELESVAGLKSARSQPTILIPGSLDGIETGVRQIIRSEPLETTVTSVQGREIALPTESEILRIKAILILRRNATRDYIDFVVLANHMGEEKAGAALVSFDRLYPQDSGQSALQQLLAQLANAMPYDLEEVWLDENKIRNPGWHDWNTFKLICAQSALGIFEMVCKLETGELLPEY